MGIYQISWDGWDLPSLCVQSGAAHPHSVPHFSSKGQCFSRFLQTAVFCGETHSA